MRPDSELKLIRAQIKLIPGWETKTDDDLRDILRTPSVDIGRTDVCPTHEIFKCFDAAELMVANAVPVNAATINQILVPGTFLPADNTVKQLLKAIFPQASKTLKAFNAFSKRRGSVIESLGLVNVTESDIADARLRTE